MGSHMSRFTTRTPSCHHTIRSGKVPSFLYLKQGIFYYRCRLPIDLAHRLDKSEVRISLRTGHRARALKLARDLHTRFQRALKVNPVSSFEELRELLQREVDAILNEPDKSIVAPDEIRRRINGYLRYLLDRDAQSNDAPFSVHITHPDGATERLGIDTFFLEAARERQDCLNSYTDIETWLPVSITELIADNVFERQEIGHGNARAIAKSYMAMQVALRKVQAARVNGDYDLEQSFYSAESTPYPRKDQPISTMPPPEKNLEQTDMIISELIRRYTSTRLADGAWKEHSLKDHTNCLKNLADILGDRAAATVMREDMRELRDTLRQLPPFRKKNPKYRNKSIEEILAMSPSQTLSIKTVNTIVEAISSMYEWAIREHLLFYNPAKGLSIKDTQPDVDKRAPLSLEDIQKVFFSGDYKISAFANPAYYWAPLIALYTGMRLEEICQLHCEDICQDSEGVWIFDIKEASGDGLKDKILKNKSARRFVPIHADLIELGLLQLRDKHVANKECRMFPELKKTISSPKYGKQVGKNFSRLLAKKGIKGTKSFHSLRHSFSQFFKVRNLHNDMFRQIFGHEIAELAGRQYGERFSAKQCLDLISMLNFQE